MFVENFVQKGSLSNNPFNDDKKYKLVITIGRVRTNIFLVVYCILKIKPKQTNNTTGKNKPISHGTTKNADKGIVIKKTSDDKEVTIACNKNPVSAPNKPAKIPINPNNVE